MEEETGRFSMPRSAMVEKLICYHTDAIHFWLIIFFFPLTATLTIASQSFQQAQAAIQKLKLAAKKAAEVPSTFMHRIRILIRRSRAGFTSAAHIATLLIGIMILASTMGIILIGMWAEEPISMRKTLQFDYSEANPKATFLFGRKKAIPVGHTLHVSVQLLVPESDYNIEIGMFQLSAEVISSEGRVITKSGQGCTLRFMSQPVRILRTVLVAIPVLLGVSSETQKLSVEILMYKERSYPRTGGIQVKIVPRSGTYSVPQVYEAWIVMRSHPPPMEQLVLNWKWTFTVWVSLYIYIVLFALVYFFKFKSFFFPTPKTYGGCREKQVVKEMALETSGDREFAEEYREWKERRKRRQARSLTEMLVKDEDDSPGSSFSTTTEEGSIAHTFSEGADSTSL